MLHVGVHFCRGAHTHMHCWYTCADISPLDILPPALPEEHVLGEMSEEAVCEACRLLATSPPHCKKGWFPTDYDLGQGQAAGPGPRLCCAGSRDFGELAVTFGAGGGDGRRGVLWSRGAACVHLGTYTLLRGSSLPGAQWLHSLV